MNETNSCFSVHPQDTLWALEKYLQMRSVIESFDIKPSKLVTVQKMKRSLENFVEFIRVGNMMTVQIFHEGSENKWRFTFNSFNLDEIAEALETWRKGQCFKRISHEKNSCRKTQEDRLLAA